MDRVGEMTLTAQQLQAVVKAFGRPPVQDSQGNWTVNGQPLNFGQQKTVYWDNGKGHTVINQDGSSFLNPSTGDWLKSALPAVLPFVGAGAASAFAGGGGGGGTTSMQLPVTDASGNVLPDSGGGTGGGVTPPPSGGGFNWGKFISAGLGLGASLGGSLIQANAAKTAAGQESAAAQQGINLLSGMYGQAQDRVAPYVKAGGQGLSALERFLHVGGGP